MSNEIEKVLKRTPSINALTSEQYSELYRTKDIYLAAFLVTRGLDWAGLEEVEVVKTQHIKHGRPSLRTTNWIYFLFDQKVIAERLALYYFNTNRNNLTVNANAFVQSILNVRSIITDPPF